MVLIGPTLGLGSSLHRHGKFCSPVFWGRGSWPKLTATLESLEATVRSLQRRLQDPASITLDARVARRTLEGWGTVCSPEGPGTQMGR